MSSICLVLTTCGSLSTSEAIVEAVVEKGQAVCATVLPRARSYYGFDQGKYMWVEEFQLLIYTTSESFEAVHATIQSLHTYEIPDIFRIDIDGGSPEAADWVRRLAGA